MKRLFIIIAATAIVASCAIQPMTPPTTVATITYDYQESSVRILEPEQSMLLSPVMADLEVSDQKITHTEKNAFADIKVTPDVIRNISEFKKIALSRAAKAHNADVLVGTIIDVVTKNQRLEITVSGYPAYYRNFRNATVADTELIKAALSVKNKNLEKEVIAAPTDYIDRKERR